MSTTVRRILTWGILLILIPAAIWLCSLADRAYYLTSLLVIFLTFAAFFIHFEHRKPQARELVLLSVMCALAVASRAVFAFLPHFKPMMAIIIVTGIAFGPESGFLTGALAGFVSNFIFGQGPWTPWQMFAYGMGGLLAGFLGQAGLLKKHPSRLRDVITISVFGFFCVLLIVGPLLDTSSLFFMMSRFSAGSAAAVYLAGLPINAVHAAATFTTLLLMGKPLLKKLDRVQVKYGILKQ